MTLGLLQEKLATAHFFSVLPLALLHMRQVLFQLGLVMNYMKAEKHD